MPLVADDMTGRGRARGVRPVWSGGVPGPPPWGVRPGWLKRVLPWLVGGYGVVVAIAGSATVNESGRMQGGLAFLLILVAVVGLVVAVFRPLDGWVVVSLWALLLPFLIDPPRPVFPLLEAWAWCLWIPALLAAAWALPRRGALLVGALSLGVVLLLYWATPWAGIGEPADLEVSLGQVAVTVLVGITLGARWDAGRALAEEQARTAAAQAAQGALAERARIAREMHDVVAHELSAIAVRAETAPYRLPGLPPEAGTELAEMASTARRALSELQQLLGVLRAEDQQADRRPQPGIATLPELVEEVRAGGTDVTAEIEPLAVPAALGLTVFRVVQQSLANAVRHAPGAPVRVRVDREQDRLLVRVTNAPGDRPGSPGAGVGVVGMRERVELHGGTLTAGPLPDGGFEVLADLPMEAGPS